MTGIVLVHGKAQDAVERHMENWRAGFSQVILICPSDDPVDGALPIGTSARAGRGLMERMILAVVMASRFPSAAILEYDALVFGKLAKFPVPKDTIICSAVFKNQDEHFEAKSYGHCPWIASGETWWKLATAGSNAQHGFIDRWLSLACEKSEVTMQRFVASFSKDKPWIDADRRRAAWSVQSGAPVVHGVKTERDYQAIIAGLT